MQVPPKCVTGRQNGHRWIIGKPFCEIRVTLLGSNLNMHPEIGKLFSLGSHESP